ncbi:MAG: gliding motility-associated C-terminal domain-containing protein, partial [Bacteroidia bacterium]|nr:gliding motility-associated C-terminal domain-containing protein [Bacteroidia bacterium]
PINNKNDKYSPVINCKILSYKLMIYNRWGQKIFESTNTEEQWDGSYMGLPAQEGVYVAIIELDGYKNDIVSRQNISQTFHLLR